jgi:hypothetical protein
VGGDWALEIETFLGPVKWHQAVRKVPFLAQKVPLAQVMDLHASKTLHTCFKKIHSSLKREKISPSSTYIYAPQMFLANFRSENQSSPCCVLDFFCFLLPRYFLAEKYVNL